MNLKIEKIHSDSKLPKYGYPGDAGMDLFAYGDFVVKPGERVSIPTGIKMAIPEGVAGLIWDKGSLSFKGGLKSMGGVVDAGYRGEVFVCLVNLGQTDYEIQKGDKVAQMVFQSYVSMEVVEGEVELDTHRGDKAFGSSGKN